MTLGSVDMLERYLLRSCWLLTRHESYPIEYPRDTESQCGVLLRTLPKCCAWRWACALFVQGVCWAKSPVLVTPGDKIGLVPGDIEGLADGITQGRIAEIFAENSEPNVVSWVEIEGEFDWFFGSGSV